MRVSAWSLAVINMHLENLIQNLKKREENNGLKFHIGQAATSSELQATEAKLGVSFPEQVVLFYKTVNGLHVEDPKLNILPLNELNNDSTGRIHFATFDNEHNVCFDTKELNSADQWNIIEQENDYIVTLTMASFWSNKIWAWIDNKRTVWKEEKYC